MIKKIITAGAAVSIFICGCAQPPVPTVADVAPAPSKLTVVSAPEMDSPVASPLPSESQVKPPAAADIYARLMDNDILNYILPNTYEKDENSRAYEVISDNSQSTLELPQRYIEWMNDSANKLINLEIRNVKTKFTPPDRELLSTLVYNYSNDINTLRRALNLACKYEIGIYRVKGGYSIELSAAPRDFNELFYMLPENERVRPFDNLFTYAYLRTIFDDNMKVRDGIEPRELPELLFPIGGNLSDYVVGDTWYASRDGGSRRHTGTDINAPEGTELYAVVDGEITDAGSGSGTGNYIVVEGADGTQYHYYHMVEAPVLKRGDKVARGDVVGYVGNTGNSTANHLHMAIITDDGYYLNPYTYLKEAYERAVNGVESQEPNADSSVHDE